MKILYKNGNIYFLDVDGKNFVIPDRWNGKEVETLILEMAKRLQNKQSEEKNDNQTD